MNLQLDARQRAMLAEMGIRVFLPEPAAAEVAAEAEDAPVVLAAPVAAGLPASAPRVVAAPVQGRMPQPQPQPQPAAAPAVRTAAATPALADTALLGAGDPRPDWLLLLDPPSEEEQRQGRPMLGDPGKLLDNMLAALGIQRRQGVYLACVPAGGDAAVAELVRQEVERLRPKIILALGRFAVQGLLQTTEPPGRLRGRPHDFHGVPVVVSYHPASLLRNPAEKGKAWVDLCLAASLLKARA